MSGLMHSLTMAARSLQTQQYAMDVTGQNIANVNTPGYTRRVVDFADVPRSHGGGVDVQAVRSVRDVLIERRLLQQVPLGSRDAAVADALAGIETALGAPGASIDGALGAFFDAYAELAETPTSAVARRQVQVAGQSLAASFGEMSDRFESARRDADARVRGAVEEINTLAGRIAELNAQIPTARANGSMQTLQDQQAQLVRRLSELADVQVLAREEGGVDVAIGRGRPLIVADTVYSVDVSPLPGGYAGLSTEGVELTAEIGGGTLFGLLHVRDTLVPGYQTSLDTLAFETAAEVNARHTSGFDLDGDAAGAFFSFSVAPVGPAGAARAIQVDPAIMADLNAIAAGAAPEPGDNGTAREIANLRHVRVLNGDTATLHDGWGDLVYRVGSDAQAAAAARDTHTDIIRQVDAMRDQVSGVSLDEEAMNLLKFQRAYEANARFFTAVDSMLATLLNLVH